MFRLMMLIIGWAGPLSWGEGLALPGELLGRLAARMRLMDIHQLRSGAGKTQVMAGRGPEGTQDT